MARKLPLNREGRSQRGSGKSSLAYNTGKHESETPTLSQSEEASNSSTSSTSSSPDEATTATNKPELAEVETEAANVGEQTEVTDMDTEPEDANVIKCKDPQVWEAIDGR